MTGTYDYNSGKIDLRKIAFGKYVHLLVWRLSGFELQSDSLWDFFDYFFIFLFSVTHRYRIISVHTLSVVRIILRGEKRVHSFIFGKLPHELHILCKKKRILAYSLNLVNSSMIFFSAFIQLDNWMRNRIAMRTKLLQVEIKLTSFSKNQG